MGYEYKSPGAANMKRAGTLLAALLAIFVLYSAGTLVTSYTTYTVNLESELNTTKEELRIISGAREECAAALSEKSSQYGECSSSLQSARASSEKCQQDLAASSASQNECTNELAALKTNQSAAAAGYRNLVRNSIKAICCTVSDVDSAAVKQWRIENDKIYCSGNLTVNCATGETNYS